MKTILKLLFLSGIIVITAFSCVKIADTAPGMSVYKTKGDYFNNVTVAMNKEGKLYAIPDYHNHRTGEISSRINITEDDTIYALRAKLINGYIVSDELGEESIFVNFTHKEYLDYEINKADNYGRISDSVLEENILDDDPFLELFYDVNRPRKYEISDTAEINQIIRNGELEKYFKRIK